VLQPCRRHAATVALLPAQDSMARASAIWLDKAALLVV
jgi:hypothetical protein